MEVVKKSGISEMTITTHLIRNKNMWWWCKVKKKYTYVKVQTKMELRVRLSVSPTQSKPLVCVGFSSVNILLFCCMFGNSFQEKPKYTVILQTAHPLSCWDVSFQWA